MNLRADQIEGLASYRSLADIPVELDRISVYLPPPRTLVVLDEIAAKGTAVVFFNPGSANEDVVERAGVLGFEFLLACSIVDIGLSPSQFP